MDITVNQLQYNTLTSVANAAASAVLSLPTNLRYHDRDRLVALARRQTGLDDLGDPSFLEGMGRIIDELAFDEFTPLAKLFQRGTFVEAVRNRLKIIDYLKQHPHIEKTPIKRPIFVLGFPRTGTTLLQNLLAQDPLRRALQFWELTHPVPVSEDPVRDISQRVRITDLVLKLAYMVNPEMTYVHEIGATTAEECWPLFEYSFFVMNMDLQSGATGYGDWLMANDARPAYAFYRQTLQLLLHRRPASQLVLKCPEHLWFLDALLDVFPDACIVWTHREPYACVSSYCSMISLSYRTLYGKIDPERVGRNVAYRFHSGVERAMDLRERLGEDRFFDVHFHDLVRDTAGTLSAISEHFDLDWTIDRDEAVRRYLDNERSDKRGAHKYDGRFYGLERDDINERFDRYIRRFGVPVPSKTPMAAPIRGN